MPVRVCCGDILESEAEVLFMTVAPDGSSEPADMHDLSRTLGNLARQVRLRWPDVWELLGAQILAADNESARALFRRPTAAFFPTADYPEFPFRAVVLVSSLAHTTHQSPSSVAEAALADGLVVALQAGHLHLATTPPVGGWRLEPRRAFRALLGAFRRSLSAVASSHRLDVDLEVWTRSASDAAVLEGELRRI